MNRIIVRDYINGAVTPMSDLGLTGKRITEVCTITDEKGMMTKFNPHTGEPIHIDSLLDANLRHGSTVFCEDISHDWSISRGMFHLHAHSRKVGASHDLLITFE